MARAMKDSGIKWIGAMPEYWIMTTIKNGYARQLGKMLCSEPASELDTYEHYLCAANIKWAGVNTEVCKQMWYSPEEKQQYLILDGDVLVMEGGMAGTACIYHGEFTPCYIQNSVHICKAKGDNSNAFLYYWLYMTFHAGYIDSICNKATIQHYTSDKLANTPIGLPPAKEQQRIAAFLDRKCAEIDAVIDGTRKTIEEYKVLKQSIITEAVTKGVRGPRPMKDSGIEWIGEIPEEWNILKCTRLIESTQNGLTRRDLDKSEGQIVLKLRNMNVNGFIDYSEVNRIELTESEISTYQLQDGDFLFVRVNGSKSLVGKCAIYHDIGEVTAYNDHIIRVKINNLCELEYFQLYLQSDLGKREIELHTSTAAGQFTISGEGLRDIIMILPPSAEQREIADNLKQFTYWIELLISTKQQLLSELETYKKSVIYEYVTGKKEVPAWQ